MDADTRRGEPHRAGWDNSQYGWQGGWRTLVYRGIALVYLSFIVGAVGDFSHGAAAVLGYVLLAVFAVLWLTIPLSAAATPLRFWILMGVMTAVLVAELPLAHAAAFVLGVFITISAVARLGARATPIVVVLALAALVVPPAIPAWHVSLVQAFDDVTPLAIPVVALGVFGIMKTYQATSALADAKAELAVLAAENERFRIARDLHDLLGHSLTTITVKAGLAARIGSAGPDGQAQALQEIAEVEVLARQAMADMRAAVSSYRDVSLAGELATGRQLLRAAGISADLPRAVDVVDPAHQELFGWVVREGLTNVVRHADASSCAVRLSASSVEITDDGVGAKFNGRGPGQHTGHGNGLSGLRERVTAAGGDLDAGPLEPRGWRLRVQLAPAGSA